MAQFYGSVVGNRGEASRMGSRESGISGHIRGWGIGASVRCFEENGRDVVEVYATSGSNGREQPKLLGRFSSLDEVNTNEEVE